MAGSTVLQGFDERKRELLDIADRLRPLAELTAAEKASRQVDHAIRSLKAERFDIAVFGRFKSGKSTFVNALLGEGLLPTGLVPLTSIVTKVVCSDRREVNVLHKDGRRERIEPLKLPDYITEKGNPENRLMVSEVEVSIDSERLKDASR